MTIRFILAPSADLAATVAADVTVEAEYGSVVIEGELYTAAHHQPEGPYAGSHVVEGGRPAPCNDPNIPSLRGVHKNSGYTRSAVVLLSHFDLDSLGGCIRAAGNLGFFGGRLAPFWALAEYVDTHGPHKLADSGASDEDLRALDAFWAWSQAHRLPRYTEVTDITAFVWEAETALRYILSGETIFHSPERDALMEAGRVFRETEDTLNAASFSDCCGSVAIRVSPKFVNHLYTSTSGGIFEAVVAFNPEKKSVTVSLADAIPGVSCRKLVQHLWGSEAGGHDGIAGSPRDRAMTEDDASMAADLLYMLLDDHRPRPVEDESATGPF